MKKIILDANKSEPDEGSTFVPEGTKAFNKSKTHLLSFIIGIFLVLLPFSAFAQVQQDLRLETDAYTEGQCPANDIQILGASLVTSDPCSSCAPGTSITADLKIRMENHTGSDRYFAICATITGGTPTNISRCYFAPANSIQTFDAGQVTYTCGAVVTLDHILLVWTAASGECPVTLANNPNGKYCYAIPPIIVSTPFVANPVSTCSATQVGMMNVALNVSGGSGNFSFLWSDGSTLGNRTNIPIGAYTVTVTDNVLKEANGTPCSHVVNVAAALNCCVNPNAGTGGSTTVCDSSITSIILADLITGEESGGVWTRESGTGGTFNAGAGTFVPTGATSSTFKYTLSATAPCVADETTVTVNVNHQPDAGTGGSTTVCDSSITSIVLADLITGEESGGVWTRESGTGGTFNAGAGTFVPTGATSSTFKYTLSATAPCVADDTTVTVNVNHQPDAGTGGSTTVCDSSITSIVLADLITGEESGGTWTRESGTGGTFNAGAGTFVPTGATSSTFKYTLSATAPCVADDTTVTVNVNHQPDAGTGGSTTVCDSSITSIILADLITGEESGGTWTRESGTGGTFNAGAGTFVPTGATSSTFKYTLSATAPCVADDTTVTVNVNHQPDAGTGGSTTVCDSSITSIILADLITGEESGGTWTRESGTGGTFNAGAGTFVPTGATSSTFKYTLSATAPCVADDTTVTVNVNHQPDAGTGGSTTVCDSSITSIILADLITGEESGGTWTRESGTGGTFNAGAGTFVPTGATSSTFKYTLSATAPCVADDTTVTVNVNHQPDAGTGGSTTVCDSSITSIVLADLITGEESGGVWTRESGTGGTFNAGAGTFVPAGASSSNTFKYTLSATSPCVADDTTVTVNLNDQPDAGTGGSARVCIYSVSTITLADLITGEDPGGTWTRESGTGGTFNAALGTFVPTDATTSTFKYTLSATPPCVEDSSTVTVNIDPRPVVNCPANSLLNEVDCGVSVTAAQTATNNAFNTWVNSFVLPAGTSLVNVTYAYTPSTAEPAAGHAPLNPILGVPGSTETSVLVTWTIRDTQTLCENSCSATFALSYNCLVTCNESSTPVLCKGASTGSITVNAQGGTPDYMVKLFKLPDAAPPVPYSTVNGLSTSSISVLFDNLPAGTYRYEVTDVTNGNTCVNINPIVISEPDAALDLVSLTPVNASCGANNGTITATISGGTAPYTIKLDSGSPVAVVGTTHMFTGVAAGPHTVTVYDANYATSSLAGCTDSDNVTVGSTPCGGHIFPTQTTCCNYVTGTASSLMFVCTKVNGNVVGNAIPGVFFYYSNMIAPAANFTIDVIQTNDGDLNKLFNVQNDRQIRLFTTSCQNNINFTGSIINGHNARYVVTGATPGATYVISIKYDVKSIIGGVYSGGDLLSTYNFSSYTKVGANPSQLVAGSEGMLDVQAGCKDTTPLPGECRISSPSSLVAMNSGTVEMAGFTTFPVPFKDNITIRYDFNYQSKARIEMYDSKGMIIMSHDDPDAYYNKEITLTPNFNTGEGQLFFIKVITDRGVSVKKVISNK